MATGKMSYLRQSHTLKKHNGERKMAWLFTRSVRCIVN